MKWEGNRESDNVEDRRGSGGGFGFGGRSVGIGTIVIALVASYFFGVDPSTVLNVLTGGGGQMTQVEQGPAARPPADDRMAKFVGTVPGRPGLPAGPGRPRPARSTAPPTKKFISI
jgi:predicted metalloprotease